MFPILNPPPSSLPLPSLWEALNFNRTSFKDTLKLKSQWVNTHRSVISRPAGTGSASLGHSVPGVFHLLPAFLAPCLPGSLSAYFLMCGGKFIARNASAAYTSMPSLTQELTDHA